MASGSQRQTGRDGARTTLDAAIQDMNHARDTCGIPPAQVAFGSVSDLLTVTEVRVLPSRDYHILVHICSGLDGR